MQEGESDMKNVSYHEKIRTLATFWYGICQNLA